MSVLARLGIWLLGLATVWSLQYTKAGAPQVLVLLSQVLKFFQLASVWKLLDVNEKPEEPKGVLL